MADTLDTQTKAFKINLDPTRYGTFAEIGAGQEVVRWFFQAGGAAGTIAKSISAYDMQVSDAIYGSVRRYVCRERLEKMLDYEHQLNIERLKEVRGHRTAFFAFADTVSARNYKGTNYCHGWMGVKFQAHPRDEDNQIIIHVRMLDTENSLQQEALGIVGVNLVYGACFLHHDPDKLLESLRDNLGNNRLEIDMIEFSGIEFRYVDNRIMSLQLVRLGLSNAAMFAADGTVLQPSEVFYKKNILVERGSFRPVCHVNLDMINGAREAFIQELDVEEEDVVEVMEITMTNLLSSGEIDNYDFLARADLLGICGKTVLISNYFEYYRLAAYLTLYTNRKIGITMGVGSLKALFDEKYYDDLEGGILESFGRLFKNDLKLYIYPLKCRDTGKLTTVENMTVKDNLKKLFGHLVDKGGIQQLNNFNSSYLHIFSREILKKIENNDSSWVEMVPENVADAIKKRSYFGYRNNH